MTTQADTFDETLDFAKRLRMIKCAGCGCQTFADEKHCVVCGRNPRRKPTPPERRRYDRKRKRRRAEED